MIFVTDTEIGFPFRSACAAIGSGYRATKGKCFTYRLRMALLSRDAMIPLSACLSAFAIAG